MQPQHFKGPFQKEVTDVCREVRGAKVLTSRSFLSPVGVIDDRGKFIYITPEEMAAVAQYIKQRGRVSIAELVQASNSLINLQPDSQAVAPTVA